MGRRPARSKPRIRLLIMSYRTNALCTLWSGACLLLTLGGCQSTETLLDVDLHGEWQVNRIDGQTVSVNTGYLAFTEDGRVLGNTGCNLFAGSYVFANQRLRLSPVGSTRRLCTEPAANQQEQTFLRALGSIQSVRISDDTLLLQDASGQNLIQAHRRDQ